VNFETSTADLEFRETVRRFIREKMEETFGPKPDIGAHASGSERDMMRRWTRVLDSAGYLVHKWPVEWGGTRWPSTYPRILEEELTLAGCPQTDSISLGFVGPMLCKFGTPEQKKRYLPRIRSGDDCWCQGFSEPNAGSDAMSIRTVATRDRGVYVVNGQKLWTSNGHFADMMFALVRTAPGGRMRPGLTFLLLSMRSEGIKVRPVIMIDGMHRVNEVTLENVRVPVENLIGEEGKGWVYSQFLLADERTVVAGLGRTKILLQNLRRVLSSVQDDGRPLIDHPEYQMRLTRLEVELEALEFMELRHLHTKAASSGPQVFPPIMKLRGTELRQRVTELTIDALGEAALEMPSKGSGPAKGLQLLARMSTISHLYQRSCTIAGGTSEIQRNIIAGVGLGL
jgi:alkylation response protein AidB-like acyl-CoA dehydrogenase